MTLKTKKPRITRSDVIDALYDHGAMSRSAMEKLFNLPVGNTSIQTHITGMRGDKVIYICEWREPEKTGMWTPIYELRTSAQEPDVPHPPSNVPWRKTTEVPEDIGEPIVLRGKGVKKEHVLFAKTCSETLGLGVWGGLLTRWAR